MLKYFNLLYEETHNYYILNYLAIIVVLFAIIVLPQKEENRTVQSPINMDISQSLVIAACNINIGKSIGEGK